MVGETSRVRRHVAETGIKAVRVVFMMNTSSVRIGAVHALRVTFPLAQLNFVEKNRDFLVEGYKILKN